MRPGAPRARFPGRWAGTRRKGRDDETTRRPRAGGEIRRGRGTGRSRVGGWTSTTPRRGRGARAQAGRGRPGAWGGRRDSGLWLARRSPARASVAGPPSGRQERKQGPISVRASGLPYPPSSRSARNRSQRGRGPEPLRCAGWPCSFRPPGKGDRVMVQPESAPFSSRRDDVRPPVRGPGSGAHGTGWSRAGLGAVRNCQPLVAAPGLQGKLPGAFPEGRVTGAGGSRRPTSSVAVAGPFGGPSDSEHSALAE